MGAVRSRMSFEHLLRLQDTLDECLCFGDISLTAYERQWDELLTVAGYTSQDYELRVDLRWDYLHHLVPVCFARS